MRRVVLEPAFRRLHLIGIEDATRSDGWIGPTGDAHPNLATMNDEWGRCERPHLFQSRSRRLGARILLAQPFRMTSRPFPLRSLISGPLPLPIVPRRRPELNRPEARTLKPRSILPLPVLASI